MEDRSVQSKERQEKLKDLILRLHQGEDEEVIKEEFAKHFQTVSPLEISVMERKLMQEDGLEATEIMRLCNVHVAIMKDYVSDPDKIPNDATHPGHPIQVLKEENLAIEAALMRVRNLLEYYLEEPDAEIKKGLLLQLDILWGFDNHYKRKENSFFPIMEAQGNYAPPQVMWGVDDEIRDLFKALRQAVTDEELERLMPIFSEFEYEMQEMIVKEENILIPMVSETFTEADWITIADEMDEIGYCIVEPLLKWAPDRGEVAVEEEPEMMDSSERLPLGTGSLTLAEVDLILDLLPLELTFVDADHIVRYYDNGDDEKLLDRTPAAIGRDMFNCHPPQVHQTVRQLVSDLEEGRKDKQSAWYQRKDGVFVHITYHAVRDEAGTFMGILEYVQDITELSQISGTNRDVNARRG